MYMKLTIKQHKSNRTANPVRVFNRTINTLKNGKVVPSWSAMCGEVAKI